VRGATVAGSPEGGPGEFRAETGTELDGAMRSLVNSVDRTVLYAQLQDYDRALLRAGELLHQVYGCPPGVARCPGYCPVCWRQHLLLEAGRSGRG